MRLATTLSLFAFLVAACSSDDGQDRAPSDYVEWDIARLQGAMDAGDLSSRELVDYYLDRIEALDHAGPDLRSVLEINPDARRIADTLDAERSDQGPRGPLHGIPVLLKGEHRHRRRYGHVGRIHGLGWTPSAGRRLHRAPAA